MEGECFSVLLTLDLFMWFALTNGMGAETWRAIECICSSLQVSDHYQMKTMSLLASALHPDPRISSHRTNVNLTHTLKQRHAQAYDWKMNNYFYMPLWFCRYLLNRTNNYWVPPCQFTLHRKLHSERWNNWFKIMMELGYHMRSAYILMFRFMD